MITWELTEEKIERMIDRKYFHQVIAPKSILTDSGREKKY